jgi:hypothetical protein
MGHEGVQKTLHQLHVAFFTAHDGQLVRQFVKGYSVC